MNKIIRVLALVALLLAAVKEARATHITLNDSAAYQNSEYSDPVQALAGHTYRFGFSYWIDTDLAPEQGGPPQYHDTFYYAFFASTSEEDATILFDRDPVDILAAIPESSPVSVAPYYFSPTQDLFLSPYFLVNDVNRDAYADVHIDYLLQEVQLVPVPEPSSLLLVGAGLTALYGGYRRRKTS